MSKVLVNDENLTNIANAIREKNGETTTYKPSEMASAIQNIETGGGKYAPRFISFANYEGTELDYELSNLDFSNITNMNAMFQYTGNLTPPLDLSFLDTSNVISMQSMFQGCNGLESETVAGFNTSNVRNMAYMFSGCSAANLELHYFDTSNVESMTRMFEGAAMGTLDISSFDMSKVYNVRNMFNECAIVNLHFGRDLGMGYKTSSAAYNPDYTLDLSSCIDLEYDSLINVIMNVYDIASAGIQPQYIKVGEENLSKLTEMDIEVATMKGWELV